MTSPDKRRLYLRLLMLCLMIGGLMLIAPEPQTRAGFVTCTNPADPYDDCTCDQRFNYCYSRCTDVSCKSQCQDAYMVCRSGDYPGGGGGGPLPPDGPCPGCVEHCDMQQLICVNEGIDTPMNCARIAHMCRQGCYQGCSQ